jgi:hypothetical protein
LQGDLLEHQLQLGNMVISHASRASLTQEVCEPKRQGRGAPKRQGIHKRASHVLQSNLMAGLRPYLGEQDLITSSYAADSSQGLVTGSSQDPESLQDADSSQGTFSSQGVGASQEFGFSQAADASQDNGFSQATGSSQDTCSSSDPPPLLSIFLGEDEKPEDDTVSDNLVCECV